MGNTQAVPWARHMRPNEASAMFHALDVHGNEYLTLKDLMAAATPGLMMPHSLPALYFFDENKDGKLTEPEFVSLVHFCQTEKRNVEAALTHDKTFRDLILRASKAGVKDCSVHGRSSYRRLSSYSNVRSVFSSRANSNVTATSSQVTPLYPGAPPPGQPVLSRSPSDSSQDDETHLLASPTAASVEAHSDGTHVTTSAESSVSSETDDVRREETTAHRVSTVAMYSSQREFDASEADPNTSDPDLRDPNNRTALDAAVLEKVVHANIHKLADLLHIEGSREDFMAWLWNLTDFNSSGVVTLEELRVLLAALSEDGIDLAELAFYREVGVPLEESIINEFDTTHAGMLSRDEFMVLADLVTREYEFWENRHLERIGDYELGRTIGRGSSGVVRLAIQVETRQKVAIKIIKKGKCSDMSKLDREIQSLMAAKHKHIVALEEVLDSESNLFIVMELCGGGSMVDIVRLYPEERMPEETARFFMRQIFEALAFCHRNGICHRDVRLDNLMLDNDGNVKITDFGHSGIYTPGWDIFSSSLVGSVYNLSPEQIMGQLYSGEKIDIWSAGVSVYCLLVGRPPFFEPEVNLLLERITACDFETPDFLSPNAKDLIRCMIRAAPEERISLQQMLHHPWFYDGPECGPSMNVVVIPVDLFFKKRPDIAEMIMAITIYQHSLHFHLADTQNPNSSPEDHRGQDWTLKCLCPRNDIKFTVSLFTKKPDSVKKKKKKKNGLLSSPGSYAALSDPSLAQESSGLQSQELQPDDPKGGASDLIQRQSSLGRARRLLDGRSSGVSSPGESEGLVSEEPAVETSASRPPRQRRQMRITPMHIAARIRDFSSAASTSGALDDVFDFEPEVSNGDFPVHTFRDDVISGRDAGLDPTAADRLRKGRGGRHSRSQSLDDPGSLKRINRSATVDAFPYQKVYPQREMPESARNLNFERPESPGPSRSDGGTRSREPGLASGSVAEQSELSSFHRSVTLNTVSSFTEESSHMSRSTSSIRDSEISQELSRHPSKALSPQSPQVVRIPGAQEGVTANTEDVGLAHNPRSPSTESGAHGGGSIDDLSLTRSLQTDSEFQPYLEVRLQDGESGLFLKICRKLKTICTTKLATAAERQKKRTGGRRSLSALRRTASTRSIESVM